MTVGFGMSIGTVNSVWAATVGDRERPAIRVRRTAVTFDRMGAVRVGGMPRFAPVVTDFADLTTFREPVTLGGRIWSSADLVAAVAGCLIGSSDPESGPVLTYPGCYNARQIAALQFALHRYGAFDVILMPEPVAAVEWLDAEFGSSATSSTLVYDLGANNVDVSVVRTESAWNQRGLLGRGIRSGAYGGRPLGAMLARYARALAPDVPAPISKVVPAEDTRRLRAWHIRNSLRVVQACLRSARITIDDIDRVLLVGGAARPAEVAEVLAELGPPVVVAPDPAHTVASGAAIASARFARGTGNAGRYARVAGVASSAAVVSALAMSAATMIGGGPVGTDGPVMEFGPALAGPAEVLREQIDNPQLPGFGVGFAALAARVDSAMGSSAHSYSGAVQSLSKAMAGPADNALRGLGAGTPCEPPRATTYADPARFINPLPFATSGAAAALAAGNAARTLPGWLPGRPGPGDQGSTTPPVSGKDGGDPSHVGTQGQPAQPGGHTPPAPIDNPAPPGTATGTGDASAAPADASSSQGESGYNGTAGPGTSDSGGSAAQSGATSAPGQSTSTQPGAADSAASNANPGNSHTDSSDAATPSGHSANQGSGTHSGATDSGDAADQGSGTHSGNAASSADGASSAADSGDAGGGVESSPAADTGTGHSSTGAPSSGPQIGADTGTAPGAGTTSAPGSGAGGANRPGGTNSAPAAPAHPAVPAAPAHPGAVSPGHPGGLGTGVAPGAGFHGGGFGGGFSGFGHH